MLIQQLIAKKRDGKVLTDAELGQLVQGISDGSMSDAQLGAFAMAVLLRGMAMDERVSLTKYMMQSGRVIHWQDMDLPGPIVDKHSTGGVGDKISLILAPIVAACGGYVPMISGRGLGHTGGTLDKFASLAGYNPYPTEQNFKHIVKQVGCAIIGQTDDLAPADRRFYATRDVTATVESIDLITASILSKKLAAGLDALVMDVKTGNGAFADSYTMAEELAQSIASVATGSGVPTRCLITDMNQVLGHSVGNAVEVQESIDCLMNPQQADHRLRDLSLDLAAHMIHLSGLTKTHAQALDKATEALYRGQAADKFAHMCSAMGCEVDVLQTQVFEAMPIQREIEAPMTGFIRAMDSKAIGMAMVGVGAGRRVAADSIDTGLGLTQVVQVGDVIARGQPLAVAHVRTEEQFQQLNSALLNAIQIGDTAEPHELVYQIVEGKELAS